jgi:hypothetical protein
MRSLAQVKALAAEVELRQTLPLLEQEPDPALVAAVLAIVRPVANATWPSGRAEHFEPGVVLDSPV